MNDISSLSVDQLQSAISIKRELDRAKNECERLESRFRSILEGNAPRRGRPAKSLVQSVGSGRVGRPKGMPMSPEAKAKISEAAKKRWAAQKAADAARK